MSSGSPGGSPRLDPASAPEDIEARSFAIIEAEVGERPFDGPAWEVARRLVHAGGDLTLLEALHLPDNAIRAGVAAIRAGVPIYTDTEMVRAGIPMRRLRPFGCETRCILAAPDLAAVAARRGITRTRAGMEALGASLNGAIAAIGNAPTALLALLAMVDRGEAAPALVIGMPVGFVNAEESKEMLLARPTIPSLCLRGRRGGSPLAAAAVNALAVLAAQKDVAF
jgi:precorrin-8X/cobalt-precorrin-8 methylmutase